ncbi:MAG: response regulator [Lachnospiraceae bacterium]|nr:response regulator [Lachnospiraceae bacterium]
MNKESSRKFKQAKVPVSDIIKHYGFQRALIFVALALFFTFLILGYNSLLNRYAKQSILESSELGASITAKEVENYLASAMDVITLSEHKLSSMLKNGDSEEAMLVYLTKETNDVQDTILPDTTGIYGCINDKYFDGSGWDPGPDYVPKERPWYTEAMADKDKIVLINPYFDLYSEQIIITIAKALSTGDNVAAIDVGLGKIQDIVLKNTIPNDYTIKMVISNNGIVVGHSDKDELGKNYLEETDSLGGYILTAIKADDEKSIDIIFKGDSYTICAVPFMNDWYSISVVKSEKVYKPLTMMLLISITCIIVTFVIFTVILIRTGSKTYQTDNLQSILSSSADIYMSLCDLDVINNTVTGIKNVNPAIEKAVNSCDHNMKEIFLGIMEGLPESDTKQAAVDFTDLSTIDERMKNTDTAVVEYLSYGNIWVRARFVVSERTPDGKVSHVLWMLENIDKEKKKREELINRSEKALAASEAKSAFLSNMSHEIRTPINAILGMNEMVLRECEEPNIIGYSNNIRSAGNTLLGLINDILDFSKIEQGKMEILPVDYDLSSMINDLVNMIRPRLDPKGLELILNIDPTIPMHLFGDDVRLKQVITNILTNAAKYTEKGTVTFSVGYEKIDNDENNVILKVSVKDTGIGIKKEDMEKLFSEFERIEEKRNRSIEGTGLGMSITKSILSLMGSALKVESEYGKGSEFSFKLMQGVKNWDSIGNYQEAFEKAARAQIRYHEKFKAPTSHILVIDDTKMNLLVVTSLLKSTEIKIDTATSGDDGIARIKSMKYDIIFLDHMMPKKDGIETLNELKSMGDHLNVKTPIICLTANAISGARDFYLSAGFDDYLTKPIDSEKLEAIIMKYLPPHKIVNDNTSTKMKTSQVEHKLMAVDESLLPEFIFTINELNPIEGIKACGTEKIYMNALVAFAETTKDLIIATRNYIQEGKIDDALINIRTIKASADIIGAHFISNLATEFEKSESTDPDDEILTDLFEDCYELIDHLSPLILKNEV